MNALIQALRSLLATNMASVITTFMSGPEKLMAKSALPVLNIYGTAEDITLNGTVKYKNNFFVKIEVAIDMRKYFDTTTGQGTSIDAFDALYSLIGDRETDGDLKTATVMGTLMQNLTISGKVLFLDDVHVEYDEFDKGEFPLYRATVTFRAEDRYNNT